ncbi:jg378, partial [Pararge aegeria aegeria]
LSMKPPMKVDKSVKESGDTARLHKKFERKLSALVNKVTPPYMIDTMQDVIIESSRCLSEYFVSKSE